MDLEFEQQHFGDLLASTPPGVIEERGVRVGFTLQPEAGVRAGQQVVVKAKVVEVGREVPLLAAQFERAVGRSGLLFSLTHASPALPILYLHLSLVTRPKALSSFSRADGAKVPARPGRSTLRRRGTIRGGGDDEEGAEAVAPCERDHGSCLVKSIGAGHVLGTHDLLCAHPKPCSRGPYVGARIVPESNELAVYLTILERSSHVGPLAFHLAARMVGAGGGATYSSPFFVEEGLVKKDALRNVWDLVRFMDRLASEKPDDKGNKGPAAKPLRKVRKSVELDPACWASTSASERKKRDALIKSVVEKLCDGPSGERLLVVQDLSGMTLLHYACLLHYAAAGQWLLSHIPRPALNMQDMNGCTALHWAAHSGAAPLVEALLRHDASPFVVDELGHAPADYARREGHHALVDLLPAAAATAAPSGTATPPSAGAPAPSPSSTSSLSPPVPSRRSTTSSSSSPAGMTSSSSSTPLGPGSSSSSSVVATAVGGRPSSDLAVVPGASPLHLAARANDVPQIQSLLKQGGVPVDSAGEQGATALHYAASAGAAKAMAALLDAGAEVGRTDGRGATALHRASACAVGSEECVGLLLDRGATPCAQDEAGASPLHVAVLAGLPGTVLLLLRRGASLTAGDEDGRASLHKAAYAGHAAICQLLIDNGADVNATHATPQPKPKC